MGSCCQCPDPATDSPSVEAVKPVDSASAWFAFGLLILLAGVSMSVSLAINLNPPAEPSRWIIHFLLGLLTTLALCFFGWPIFRGVVRLKITLESLFVLGLLGALGASLYSSFTGTGHVYYEVVLVLLAIYRLGQLLSQRQLTRTQSLSENLPGLRAQVLKRIGGDWIKVPVRKVGIGDEIFVKTGEIIAVDGVILDGRVYVEESAHTGEPFPVSKSEGDTVQAGTTALDGEIIVEARTDGTSREIDRLARELGRAEPGPSENLARKILEYFVLTVVIISVSTLIYWGSWRGQWEQAIFHALAVALVACPCGLGLAIPLALRRARFDLTRLGLRLREPDVVERLAKVTTVLFDKTGTLSEPQIALRELVIYEEAPGKLRHYLAEIQRQSTHPVARPFWNLVTESDGPLERLEIRTIPARGIEGKFLDRNKEHSLKILGEDSDDPLERKLAISLDGARVATAILEEKQRDSAGSVLARLSGDSFRVGVVTGDRQVSQKMRESLDLVETGATPQQKGEIVRRIETDGETVLFVGDGVNDSEAIRSAHISIATADGMQIAKEAASASLVRNDLEIIVTALMIARATRRRLKHLLVFVLVYNLIGMSLAAIGVLHPVAAALLMFASSITVLRAS